MSKALVLSGGSVKGAYQAGAIQSVIEAGFLPDQVFGISTGALSAGYLVNHIGARTSAVPTHDDWRSAGAALVGFYEEHVTSPKALIRARSKLSIAWDALRSDFDGLTDTGPLRELIKSQISAANLRKAATQLYVGSVNMASGEAYYATSDSSNIIDYIYASAAIPMAMPLVKIAGGHFYDGGLRDIAPIGRAIDGGADEIVCIVCQASALTAKAFQPKNALHLIGRLMDVVTNEIIRNDISEIERINNVLAGPPELVPATFEKYRKIKWRMIQPPDEITIDIGDFKTEEIRELIGYGRDIGRKAMAGEWNGGVGQ
ncbi:MAG: patatin-like phospholipase family protein [Longimicrobiales bacterium]